MNSWKETTLDKVIELVGGGTPRTSIDEYWNGDIPWLSVVDFNNDSRWVEKTDKTITENGLKNSSTKLLDAGDLIISARGTVGELAQLKYPMAFNQSCYGIKANENSDINFLFYLIKWKIKNIKKNVHGAVFDTITRNTFGKIDILLPPLPEQKQIAAVLSSLDDKIELLRAENETLEKIAQTIFKEWFVNFKIDGKKLKIKNGLPEEWRIGRIKDLIKILSGFAFKSEDFLSEGRYKLVTIKNVQDGFFEKVTKDRLQEMPSKMPKYCHLQTGDILLSLTGNVGRICHVVGDDYLLNQRVAKLSSVNKKDFAFVYLFFRQKEIFNLLGNISSGTAQQNLSPVQTGNLEAVIPERKVLDNFAEVANPMFEKIFNNLSQIQTISRLRDTLLPKLMSGEITINNK